VRKRYFAIIIGAIGFIALIGGVAQSQEAARPDPLAKAETIQASYQTKVRPLLQKYCYQCHGETKPKGDVRLDKLTVDFVKGPAADLETWHDVLQNLHRGEMPPRSQKQPTRAEHAVIVDWLQRAFVEARQQRESTGGKVAMRRLTSYEFHNTLEDLLDMKLNYSKDLLAEVPSKDGFLNNASVLTTSSQHVRTLWSAARFAMSRAIVTGPQPKTRRIHAEQFSTFGNGKKTQKTDDKGPKNVLLPDTALMVPVEGFPAEGKFRLRVNLKATGPKTCLLAWFKVSKNNQSSLIFAKPEVAPSADAQNVDIYGNIEDITVFAERNAKGSGVTPYLCLSNVGSIHFFRGGNGSIYPRAMDLSLARQYLGDSKKLESIPMLQINYVELEAPFTPAWPPSHHTRIMIPSKNSGNEKVYSREVIAAFMERAYRRPVQAAEVEPFVGLYAKIRPRCASLEEAMRETLALVLVSPNFLYLAEPRDAKVGKASVTDYEWATRLSYFLWNSMPDAELLGLAQKGGLKDATARQKQIDRMLADEKAWRFVETFTDQWWNLSYLDKIAVNQDFHPSFDEDLKLDMRRESQLFFAEFVKKDLSMLRLIDADFTFVNNRLADHYRIPHGSGTSLRIGSAFERVTLAPEHKRNCGILTHGSVLLLNSDGVESHPIKRAVWVRNAIFDDPPPEPPAEVPELNTEDRGKNNLTLKQRIEQHRSNQSCNHCHSRVDPWGIPLEQYDALGLYRTKYMPLATTAGKKNAGDETDKKTKKKARQDAKGQPTSGSGPVVDAKTELPDGCKVDGVEDLKKYILTEGRQRFARAIVRKTLSYSLGRSLEVADQPLVEDLTRSFTASDYRFKALVLAIVQSEPFLMK
jgi:hypothetical protein